MVFVNLLLISVAPASAAEVTAKIVSCPAWTLNKHKELRLFLKGDGKEKQGEILDYAGVTIDWIRGKRAIMTIFDEDGTTQIGDPIQLYELKTREEMHQLMLDKGFHRKTAQEELQGLQAERLKQQLKQLGDGTSLYGQQFGIYLVVVIVLAGVGAFANGRRRKNRGAAGAASAMISRV